jgi:hypothetical protein
MRFGKLTCKRSAEARGAMFWGKARVNDAKVKMEMSMFTLLAVGVFNYD